MAAFKMLLKAILFIALTLSVYYGCRYLQGAGNAVIRNMTPSGIDGPTQCWVEMEFKSVPIRIDARDVKLVFTGEILAEGSASFDWPYMANNAYLRRKTGLGRDKANISSENPPPLKTPIEVCFPLKVKPEMKQGASFDVTVTLFWGGRKQDFTIGSFRYQYRIER